MSGRPHGFATRAIHAGRRPIRQPVRSSRPCTSPRHTHKRTWARTKGTSTRDPATPRARRWNAAWRSLEGGAHGLCFASGLAATACVLYLLGPGDHAICGDDVYGGTYRQFKRVLRERYGIAFSYVDMTELGNVERALRPETKLVWVETPTNPLLQIVDIPAVVGLTRRVGALVAVDNTFATPCNQRPLELGADVVVHSTGRSTWVAIPTWLAARWSRPTTQWPKRCASIRMPVGATPGPMDCFLVLRGLKTLAVRMRAHQHGRFPGGCPQRAFFNLHAGPQWR